MKKQGYGIIVAISMIVGIVIGSGVFFKADDILIKSGGNFNIALLAWLIGGLSILFGALTISSFASRISKSNGLIDYFEYSFGKFAGYIFGWFLSIIYYPAIIAVVVYVAANFTVGLLNLTSNYAVWIVATTYLVILYLMVVVSRLLSSRFQVTTTVIKLIPLFLIAVIGTIVGLVNHQTIELFNASNTSVSVASLPMAVVTVAFTFDGWFIATSINDELKNPKKDLPKALALGAAIIIIIYIAYFLGILSTVGIEGVLTLEDGAASFAATQLFGKAAGTILIVFIIISCLGTVNGLIMVSSRAQYQIATRNSGIMPSKMMKINKKTNTPVNSTIMSLVLSLSMLFIWFGNFNIWTQRFIDISEVPIVLNYIGLAILYLVVMFKFKDLGFIKRFIFPSLAILGASIVIYGGIINPSIGVYLTISLVIVLLGALLYKK